MKTLEFHANRKQWAALEGLSYWIADKAYITERFGENDPELPPIHETIIGLFEELDALGVPFWVQNSVIAFSASWRDAKQYYLDSAMQKKNIFKS